MLPCGSNKLTHQALLLTHPFEKAAVVREAKRQGDAEIIGADYLRDGLPSMLQIERKAAII